jgi:molybdate transport system permease protein
MHTIVQEVMIDYSPIWISFKCAAFSIFITFFLGLFAARWMMTLKNKVIQLIFDGIFTLPLVLPPTVMGFFLLLIFGVNQPIGSFFLNVFGVRIAFSFSATVIAAVVISFPIMYRSARGALEQVDTDLVDAARTLGMSETSIFFKVLVPNALPGIISGGVLSFARGLGEFGATAMLAGNIVGKTRTLPLAVYSEVVSNDMHSASFYVVVIIAICFTAVILLNIYQLWEKKKRGY